LAGKALTPTPRLSLEQEAHAAVRNALALPGCARPTIVQRLGVGTSNKARPVSATSFFHRLERAGGLGDAVLAGAAVTQWSL
jgi:hypothetical protein